MKKTYQRWAILWPIRNRLDGYQEVLMGDSRTGMTWLFRTREEARQHHLLKTFNSSLRNRADLRREPHGWRARRVVKIQITVEVVE